MKFSEIQLHPILQENINRIGYSDCTPIQEKSIPLLRQGKDLSGLAQTGTGKTAAFLLPLIDRLMKSEKPDPTVADSATVPFADWKKKQYVLILVPTRELAEQVQENAKTLLQDTGFSSVSVYGGTTYEKQIAALKQGVEFVIATPGRFIDLYKEHVADLSAVRAIVFDEADRMFDMGFRDDMKFILKRVPRDRQFLVFSATLNFEVLNVAYENGADPIEVNISRDQAKAENVKDYMVHLGQDEKPRYLLSLLKKHNPRQAIIFSNYKHNVERIAKFLTTNGVPAMGISSLLTQAQRNRVMAQFKAENESNILVATDVAARGLDILGVDLVLNFDLSDDPENYVHRIGRTGRAGQTGQAFSLVGDRDIDALQRIEEYLGNKLEVIWMDDQELVKDMQAFPREEGRRDRPSAGHRGDSRGGPRSGGRRPSSGGGNGRDYARGNGGGSGSGRGRDHAPRGNSNSGPRHHGSDSPAAAGAAVVGAGSAQAGSPRAGARVESHRDRNSGRHRPSGNTPNQTSSNGPQQGRRDHSSRGPRPHAKGPHANQAQAHSRQSGRGGLEKRSSAAHQGARPHHHKRPATTPTAQGLGKKVTGFFKRLFGKES